MSFATEVDEFMAKLQVRVDQALGEARVELKEMAEEAERDIAELRRRFGEGWCEDPVGTPAGASSQTETSPNSEDPADIA